MPFYDSQETNELKSKIQNILRKVPDFVTDSGELKLNVIKEEAEKGSEKLLEVLINDSSIKNVFFKKILDSYVFETAKFKEILEYSSVCNSYSKFSGKKIGLYFGDSALTDRSEVVLNFPFKDCVLEGGQTKEDGLDEYFEWDEKTNDFIEKKAKRREVFYNETLAHDEIDNLFAPKAFCNVKRYERNSNGTDKVASAAITPAETTHLNRNAEINRKRGLSDDTITDNLIIKGNNLLALHSLKKEFAGKIKLIYIDVPYNTGSDSFSYNDNFNHSSWLTFMKNRLEVARELLREDGCIFVQCDDNEQAYLKVLMDDVFRRENFVGCVVWKRKRGRDNSARWLSRTHEYFLIFAKEKDNLNFNLVELDENTKKAYKNPDNDCRGDWRLLACWARGTQGGVEYDFTTKDGKYFSKRLWLFSKTNLEKMDAENRLIVKGDNIYRKLFLTENQGQVVETIWDNIEDTSNAANVADEIKVLFGSIVFSTPKPELFIKRILQISTSPSDIVLDYHLGSGTTAAVAHKMNRQYIGVEQMDYIETVAVERLKKVICGEQGGISKSVNWQGGGSFVYMELAKKNERASGIISACKNLDELVRIFDTLSKKYFLHYNVRVKEFRNSIVNDQKFQALPLKRQKEMFIRMLDLNQLYVNAGDRNDETSSLTKNDIVATENFYRLKNE